MLSIDMMDKTMFYEFSLNSSGAVSTTAPIDTEVQGDQSSEDDELVENSSPKLSGNEEVIKPASGSKRDLPSFNIDDSTIDDAYVQFILYCNPFISTTTDTTELRRGFRLMPKTDGRSFDTMALFNLIKKFEAGEIYTWSQLVVELGVEPPNVAKNQSTQKVQQFAVRLKRWLHAFHIDAFFQHCLGHPCQYATNIPATDVLSARDGVPPEEDLALRALLPEWRPKRGRRKIQDDVDLDNPTKRIKKDEPLNPKDLASTKDRVSPQPQSAFPWVPTSNLDDTWPAVQTAVIPGTVMSDTKSYPPTGQHNFWVDMTDNTPSSPYPQSAITPRHDQPLYDPPRSANSLFGILSNRPRKRHSTAVSAAWMSGLSSTPGKIPRGRPPNNRSIQGGAFSSFPVKSAQDGSFTDFSANSQKSPQISNSASTPVQEPVVRNLDTGARHHGQATINVHETVEGAQNLSGKPSKLSLQVPPHTGGSIRLATPPPKVLVNGADDTRFDTNSYDFGTRPSADFFDSIDEEVSELWDESHDSVNGIDWKRRALLLARKLKEKDAELKAVKRRILEAVM